MSKRKSPPRNDEGENCLKKLFAKLNYLRCSNLAIDLNINKKISLSRMRDFNMVYLYNTLDIFFMCS